MKKAVFLFVIIVLTVSCQNKTERSKTLASSTGRFNELLIITTEDDWSGDAGTKLKQVIATDVLGLPQPEPQFSIIRIEPNQFSGLLERTRNVLKIQYADSTGIDISKNIYAKPQVIITLTAKNVAEMVNLIEVNQDKLVQTYKQSDLADLRRRPVSRLYPKGQFKFFNTQHLNLRVPDIFEMVDDQKDFIWFRDETYDPGKDINGSKNIICYTLPLTTDFMAIKDSITVIRNQIGKQYLPGPTEETYMITEAAYTPHVFKVTFKDRQAYKTLGKWEIYNSYMAGPFISYTIEDKSNSRIVVVEGFVYAPLVNKRDFMFELEAIIGTLSFEQ